MHRLILLATLVLIAMPAIAQNPHDGYMFWMPNGELKIGDAASEKEFAYSATPTSVTFTVHPRATRMGIAAGQIVIIRPGAKDQPEFTVDGKAAGKLGLVTFLPEEMTKGKDKVVLEVKAVPTKGNQYIAYYTDDAAKLNDSIAGDLEATIPSSIGYMTPYRDGIIAFWKRDYKIASERFSGADRWIGEAHPAPNRDAQRLFRRLARWADAEMKFPKLKTGQGFYDFGLYCATNGFWDLAADSFRKSTELMPKNPDAWFMLGDAMSYQLSDLDMKLEKVMPYYQKAADLYPTKDSNTYRNHVGFFRKLKVKDGDKDVVLNMSQEQMDYVRKVWGWCATITAATSRGALRMVNDYHIYEDEFDNTTTDDKPFWNLFKSGDTETFMKYTGWGASGASGHDCGPNLSSPIEIGLREWDVMLHEWNHTLDWAMLFSELGIGVPPTHSSDWCGFEPISSMGMGHKSCNRYYMTPGMYRMVRGSDPITTPQITDWLVWFPQGLGDDVTDAQFADKDQTFVQNWAKKLRETVSAAVPPALDSDFSSDRSIGKAKIDNGYVDLKATFPDCKARNCYAFALTYVYSPAKQKVRMWVGADENIRMWLNGRLVHKGVYWSCVYFQEAKEKEQNSSSLVLEKGWNKLVVQVTNMQCDPKSLLLGPKPDAWGFAIRLCDMYNKEVPGLKYQSAKPDGFTMPAPPFVVDPRSPKTYNWNEVKDDYTTLLPQLTIDDLRAITGYKTMTANGDIFFDLSKETVDAGLKPYVIEKSDPKNVVFNNEMNWYFAPKELTAFVRYKRGTETRDLLFIRPEGYETYTTLLPVGKEAKKLGIKKQADQVIGYLIVPSDDCANGRAVIVLDTYLGAKPPVDEEALLDAGSLK